jgi:hypothetical protein
MQKKKKKTGVNQMTITKEMLIEEGYNVGKYYNESIYILQDGTLVDGDVQEGIGRCEDHRMMESFSEFDRYDGDKFWNDIMETKGLIMIIPETQEIYIHPNHMPTKDQEKIIFAMVQKSQGFTVHEFK